MKKVLVKWWDSNVLHGWQSGEYETELALCETLGFLCEETEKKLVIAQTVSKYGAYLGVVIIARGCVESVREVRVR